MQGGSITGKKTRPRFSRVKAVNRHGGRAELIRLPDLGIRGNTHFIMSDLKNADVADLVEAWLLKAGVD